MGGLAFVRLSFAAYKSETHSTEHALHYTRTYELKDVRVPAEHLEELKQFFRQVADDERAYAILKALQSRCVCESLKEIFRRLVRILEAEEGSYG